MTTLAARGDLAVSIQVAEPDLAARLGDLIGQAQGLRLADSGEQADLILSRPDGAEGHFE